MSQTHNQLVASHEQMDLDEAQERVQAILSKQAGPTLTPALQTQPQASARDIWDEPNNKPRKKRSDAGVPKKAPADPDEIVLRMSIDKARTVALLLGGSYGQESALIQDQIIAQLQKRLDALQKQK